MIQDGSNYIKYLHYFHLLGRLLQLFPDLIQEVVLKNAPSLHHMINGMMYPSDDVRSAVAYIFLQIYSSSSIEKAGIFPVIDSVVAKGILSILKSGLTKDVTKIGLALLKVFISGESKRILLLFENSNEDVNFVTVLKKVIISVEPVFQVCAVQCLCHILSESSLAENYIHMLIAGSIPELLFEVINGNNELLIETIICCILMFTRYPLFFEKCHILYGITSVFDISTKLINNKNWKLLCLAFDLLISLTSSEQYSVASSAQSSLFDQALKLIEKSYKVRNLQVLLVVNKFFNRILRKECLPFSLHSSKLFTILSMGMKNLQNFFSSHAHIPGKFKKYQENNLENLPIEVQLLISGLDILFCFIQILREHYQDLYGAEELFSCPVIESTEESISSLSKINFQEVIQTCILALDEIFVPYCLLLNTNSSVGKISFFHFINVLYAIYEDPFDNPILLNFAKKLVKAKVFNHIWNVKTDGALSTKIGFEESKERCNQCLVVLLKYLLEKHDDFDAYMNCVKNGLNELNCSLEDCSSVLSQKCELQNHINSFKLHSVQVTFLCLCYVCYLNNALMVNSKILIPHLIYYATCNSEIVISSAVTAKHLIFLLAACMFENHKCQIGLTEASTIMWDALSKITFFNEIYTHHEVLLWWCFRNPLFNPFSSFVFQRWLEFSLNMKKASILYSTFKILLDLLSTNAAAQETFIRQFESNSEISFHFLRNSYDSEVYKTLDPTIIEKLEFFILALAQHIQNCIIQLLIMENHAEKKTEGNFLSHALECVLWCFGRVYKINPQINIKFVFHVTNFCCNSNFENKTTLLCCLKFLQFVSKKNENDSKAWFVMTGNPKFFPFLQKCLTMHNEFEIEALHLLVITVIHQIDSRLKSSSSMKISLIYILKWLNNPNTKLVCFELLNKILDMEFNGTFLRIKSIKPNIISTEESLNRSDLRLLVFHAQNSLVLGNPTIEKVAFMSYMKLLNYISKVDSALENHIMLQPWSRILLESKLDNILVSWKLFEKWFSYKTENITLIGVMQQFTNRVLTCSEDLNQSDHNVMKLCSGVYKKYISKETKNALDKIIQISENSCITQDVQESNVISEIENLVTNYISKNSCSPATKD
ncbi:meiosis inhibitor protein 1 [Nephila pilipes]|uniref:Meiosis inhibitor protein 1 n=1 Tax=Nephila pilipes TaxID=299642 RepID=A0A8X6TNR3_NEPPI|nr:meiosis inhibitor protein 1 [Nephila pilipes]